MTSGLATKSIGVALGVAFALSATATFAVPLAAQEEAPHMLLAQAGSARTAVVSANDPAAGYPAYQAGVRRAAAEGRDALRHYIERTRMIYGFYYWDFATRD